VSEIEDGQPTGAPPQTEGAPEIVRAQRLPVLPLKTVAFPGGVAPLVIGQERSVRLVDEVMNRPDRALALVAQRDGEVDEAPPEGLYEVGVAGVVQRMLKAPDGTVRILVEAQRRVRVGPYSQTEPFLEADVTDEPEVIVDTPELEALTRNLQSVFARVIELVPYLPEELQIAVANVEDARTLTYLVAGSLRLETDEQQKLLAENDVEARLREITVVANRELEVLELGAKIQEDVRSDLDQGQREMFLRQQMRAIQAELGETDEAQAEVNELRERLVMLDPPEVVRAAAERELSRLERLPPASAEHGVIRTYIDWILSMPWNEATDDNLDLERAKTILDEDHYGLAKVKDRILEFLAVGRLKGDAAGPVLCFVGPPGVGKTSLGRSIARALGRRFARISVGGVRDESEIRGHRRTYIGSMPGTVVRAIRDAESINPVLMIDEIDKMGADFRGDPASAMLEVLDPAQHDEYRDHYLDLPLDLARVLFICTANVLETIPPALLDRMEVIRLSGYTDDEKTHIARRFLLPRQVSEAGLTPAAIELTDDGLEAVIGEYTREAGVRGLERQLGALARKVAREVAEGNEAPTERVLDRDAVRELLGNERYHDEVKRRTSEPGVATGLAVTGAGGEILFVEAQAMPGSGRLTVTGQLGDVMRESAQAALSHVRAQSAALGLDLADDYFTTHDVHVHVPAGAVPKDGPSAGVTITTALVSALSGRPVSADVGMTGEVTLTGQVLPIGGVKEKVLAASRAGLRTVVLPKLNEDQLTDLPEDLADGVEIQLADRVEKVIEIALVAAEAPA
jgi:ATP-dependent Lon protease